MVKSYQAASQNIQKRDFSDRKTAESLTADDFKTLSLPERNALFESHPDIYRALVLGSEG